MLLEQGLSAHLEADAAIAALVSDGGSPEQFRIWPLKLKQNWTSPALTFQRISATRGVTLDGPLCRSAAMMQVDIWAREGEADALGRKNYASAKQLADLVRKALDGLSGDMGGVAVGPVRLERDQDLFEDETRIYRVSMDFTITHKET